MLILYDSKLKKFIKSLDPITIDQVLCAVNLLEKFGHELYMPTSKQIAPKLFELRTLGKRQVRIFYTFHKNAAILLHAFIKGSAKTPKRELKTALRKLRLLDSI